MGSVIKGLKDRKVVRGLLFVFVVVLPASLLYAAWLTDQEWSWSRGEEQEDHFETLTDSLKNVRCPAKQGLELRDYWNCLWHSSITEEGMRQHRTILREYAMDRVREDQMQHWSNKLLLERNATTKAKRMGKRTKRDAVPALPFPAVIDSKDPTHSYTYRKMDAIKYDLLYGVLIALPVCQQAILPGESIRDYIHCLLKTRHEPPEDKYLGSKENNFLKDLEGVGISKLAGFSLSSTFQPSTYPPMTRNYIDQITFPLINKTDTATNTSYLFRVEFQPLGHEENLGNFWGADPYLEDDFSVYRYLYNNLIISDQAQPAWTYRGLNSAKEWHSQLPLEKFYVPLKYPGAAKDIEFIAELAQSYPGIGEITEILNKALAGNITLKTPYNYKWTKSSGYSVYTRYLLPLLEKDDLTYYKSKGLIDPSVTLRPDKDTIQDMVDALKFFRKKSEIPGRTENKYMFVNVFGSEVDFDPGDHGTSQDFHAEIDDTKPADLSKSPFIPAYLQFLAHFFGIDIAKWLALKAATPDVNHPFYKLDPVVPEHGDPDKNETIHWEMELIRRLIFTYVDAVVNQERCLQFMLGKKEGRLETQEDFDELWDKLQKQMNDFAEDMKYASPSGEPEPDVAQCFIANNTESAIKHFDRWKDTSGTDPSAKLHTYHLSQTNFKYLYNSYFNRKDARQRYTLPKYPVPFPVCKHNDPSPIDIRTERSRQSSISDYHFGNAAYRLNRFFMFFPLDGSPLLTVGIVDGQRLDDSSVRLTGGAVKGENLTFQYMHIHYANNWRSVGSEHWINGKGATMELQMVFTIAGSADSIKYWHVLARVQNQLFQFREKLVIILSVLVDVLETDKDVEKKIKDENLNQDPNVFETFSQAAYLFRKMPVENPNYEQPRGYVSDDPVFRFIDFIPQKPGKFYTYRGSLSWPPCFGYVIWSVFEQRLYMSERQFKQFALIPSRGVQDSQLAGDNVRRFEDIYVEDEHNTQLSFDAIEQLKRQRTVDRYILVGYNDIHTEDSDKTEGLVGESFYYVNVDDNGSSIRSCILTIMVALLADFSV